MLPKHRRRKMHHGSRKTKKKRKTNPVADVNLSKEKVMATENTQLQESESSESSSESEEENPYQQLVASISGQSSNKTQLIDDEDKDDTDDESDDVDDDDDSDDEEDNVQENDDGDDADMNDKMAADGAVAAAIDDTDDDDDDDDDDNDDDDDDDDDGSLEIDDNMDNSDPFKVHFEKDIGEEAADKLSQKGNWTTSSVKIPHVGKAVLTCSESNFVNKRFTEEKDLKKLHVKQNLVEQVEETSTTFCSKEHLKVTANGLSAFQNGIFTVLNKYQDLYYTERSHLNGEEIRLTYCLHALNHVLKTRTRIVSHSTKLKTMTTVTDTDDYRDQGLTRPKVLIVLPFRESALRIVNMMIHLLKSDSENLVSNKKRFLSEYKEEDVKERSSNKPDDYQAIFTGNTDDHFRIGLGVAKKTLKLYTKFYSSDIILASPLGLRTVIGAEGEKDSDYDFLNSIELLIFDQADIYLMQNWDHILHIMNHLHLQPKDAHGIDFSRVRMWTLSGWSRFYRQTLIFSSVNTPELNALYNKYCHNYAGKVSISRKSTTGSICQVVTQLPQVFHKIDCSSFSQAADTRFEYFIKKILPNHKDPVMQQTLIFIPSYFDFVRLRNYFVREEIDFECINEYSTTKNVSRARNFFYHGKTHFMLYTERFHFYRRYRIRGIRHIIFYQLPVYSQFYSEMCNMIQDSKIKGDNKTVTCVYSRYDAHRLSDIVGTDRASHMMKASKKVHMFVTGDNT